MTNEARQYSPPIAFRALFPACVLVLTHPPRMLPKNISGSAAPTAAASGATFLFPAPIEVEKVRN